MKRRIRRLFSLILSLVLVVGLFPGTIIATAEIQNGGGFRISGDTESWNMKLSDTGVLTWDAQAGATGYSIRFFLYANGTGSLTHISGLNEPSCDLKAWFEKYKIESGGYLFNITAIGVGESPDISASYVSALPKLSEPQNVKWNGTKATWDSVSNATSYRVSLYFDNYAAGKSEVVTGTEYDFGTSVTDGCWVKVKALADGYRNSNEAESEKYGTASVSCGGFNIGEDTSAWNISISDAGVLTWNPQAGATGYSIRFFVYADGSGALTIIQGLTEPSCDLKAWFEKYKI